MGNNIATYNKYKSLLFFIRKYKFTELLLRATELLPPQDLKEAFSKFTGGGSYMSAEQLHGFLMEHQGQVRKTCQETVNKVDQNREHEITLDELFRFLLHDDSNAPLKAEVHHDMGAPLSHYFIYTGHNSYLTGNQLSSDCSEEPIIKALKRGVRVIELDLWPTYNKHDIKVDHGWTLANPASVIICLESIKEYGFVASQYPVIITIEDHLTTDLRAKFAENGSDHDEGNESACECARKPYQVCSPDYKHIITIHNTKLKGCLKDKLKTDGEVRRLSWSEKTLEKASESHGTDILRFTQKNILRVYPSAMRVKSSNFKPNIGWMYGAQMVACNMQGLGKSLWLMQGMFRANGGCGYVKKPQFLMQKYHCDNEFDPTRIQSVKKKTFKVKVYMGHGWSSDLSPTHFDKCSPPDFYTKVCIVGMPDDVAKKKTKVMMDNWFPVWDEEFEFSLIVPELALLLIQVKDKDPGKDDFAGQTCLPVSELKHGFHSVPLYNKKGEKFKSVKPLMQFQFE
ncbi:phosphoinositide phospholipase C 6-like isoform X2 [Glycine soja]|uniref:phosphoinositide phospholipase C 6-like isoform X2 n=1 Tax=Glycine soja TaxID=3848 RepID=UPI00103DF188|nr:phosphoinositide phospholipase C 6-like isoform X2 [Glycine soja]